MPSYCPQCGQTFFTHNDDGSCVIDEDSTQDYLNRISFALQGIIPESWDDEKIINFALQYMLCNSGDIEELLREED